jgi:nucleotidyltransferase/DNA polymerase involved in DNA repair
MERKIMHIDMDAFFAAIEQLDKPAFRGKPVIVGADPRGRGVVSTCSYEARRFGVHSAMPIREAFNRCPQGIFLPPRGARYAQVSRQIMKILAEYTSLVEPLSLDEAFLDLTGSEPLLGPAEEIARQIVARIEQEIGLSASVGIAPNKFLAKLASDLRKPKGFVVITPDNATQILEGLPVSKIWGVGPKTEAALKELGIHTIGMLQRIDPQILIGKFGEMGEDLYKLAHGRDERPVSIGEEAKSIGHEFTFQTDTDDHSFLGGVLLWLADQVGRRLRRHGLKGRVITVKIRDSNFKTITRRITLNEPTDFEETICREARKLAEQAQWGGKKVRLIGISVSGFSKDEPVQLNLFTEPDPDTENELQKLHQTVDQLRDRYGEEIITKGTILHVKKRVGHKD